MIERNDRNDEQREEERVRLPLLALKLNFSGACGVSAVKKSPFSI